MSLLKKVVAEAIGTCILTLIACGIAVQRDSIEMVALGFGLVIVALAYSIGNISGCHINPAVSLAMAIRKKITWKEFAFYVIGQVIGAFVGTLLLALFTRQFKNLGGNEISIVLTNQETYSIDVWSYVFAFAIEVILTFVFVFAIFGVTDSKYGNSNLGGIVIGLVLLLVHLFGINFTGTSVNPARGLSASVCQAFSGETKSLSQVWIWVLAPFAGGALAALAYNWFFGKNKNKEEDNMSNVVS